MNNDRLLGSLAMCRAAGKLKIGFDASREAIFARAPLVVIASDASQRTRTSIESLAKENGVKVLALTQSAAQIEAVVGRSFAVAALVDENFAKLVCKNHGVNKEAGI